MGYSPLIDTIKTLFLACVGSLQTDGEFVTVSRIYGVVNSLPSNILKPILFSEGVNSSSYIIKVA